MKIETRKAALIVEVSDDGRGFRVPLPDLPFGGAGLANMRERSGALGGRLTVRSAPGRGTRVRVELPLRRAKGRRRA